MRPDDPYVTILVISSLDLFHYQFPSKGYKIILSTP